MLQIKNILLGKVKVFILVFFSYYLLMINSLSENNTRTENYAVLTILDKVNSQSEIIEIEVGKEYKFKNLSFLMIGHSPHLHQLDLLITLCMIFG